MELVSAVLGSIIDRTVGAAGRQIGYVCRYAENIQILRQKLEELGIVICNIEGKIEDARIVGDIIRPEASDWQVKATRAKVDAENFLNDNPSDGHESCLKGLRPNIYSRYVISKDAKKKTTDVVRLAEQGSKFQTVSGLAPLPSYESRVGNPYFEDFESRKSAREDIMHSLEDEGVRIIGIYGTGGVGKTAMADKVGAQAENDRIFDEIVKVVVTQNPAVGKIQDELAAQLNLKLKETTEVGKAIQLLQRLTNGKKILIILDDVWKELDLSGIGIPLANGCKIILTTRSERVCQDMKVNKKIPIGFLSREEAWILFRKKMENDVPDDLHEVARQVCKECAGLPIAILAIGTLLDGNLSSFVWNNMLERLRQSQLKDIPGVSPEVYASLAVSYHKLDSDEAKACFLFCSLFPEDFNIPIEYILRYGKGVGVPKEMETLSSKRLSVHYLVDYLKRRCLLLEGGDDEHVKMHDVIRDVAISIASEEGQHVFFSEMEGNHKRWEGYYITSSGSSEIRNKSIEDCLEFPDKLDCAKLNTLILACPKYRTLEIPPTFSHSMIKLKVLVLVRMTIPEFPASIRSIVDMEVLCLEECDLGDLSWVGNFKKLEMLILQRSHFKLLPAEIGELSHLKLLDLRDCRILESISCGIISKLSTLQELFLPLTTNLQSNLEEVKALSQLEALEMRVLTNSNLMEFPPDFGCYFWAELTKFRIFINIDYWNEDLSMKNTLKLKGVSLSSWAAVLLKRVERSYVGWGSYPKLIDKLQQFEADACQGISEFLSVIIDVRSLVSHLSVMKITGCNLEYILSPSMAKVLTQLQTLEVKGCENLKSIVGGCQENDTEEVVIFHQLEKLYLTGLPMLVSFYTDSREGCALQPLFTRKVGLPKLMSLRLEYVDRMKEIWAGDILPPPNSSLRYLNIFNCHELVRAIPPAILPSLHRLEWLSIHFCNSLREIVGGEAASGGAASSGLPELRSIRLSDLPNLENLFSVPLLTCQRLSTIQIWKCGRLINLFSSPSPALAFAPDLRNLEISDCEKMEEITEFLAVDDRSASHLSYISIFRCNLKYVLSPSMAKALPQLRTLWVQDCENLKAIVGGCQENDTEEVVIFHQLEELRLEGLPTLVSFYPDSTEGCALFTRKVGLPKLKGLTLKSIGGVKEIWAGDIPPPPDSPLWHLTISNCHEMLRAIPPAILPSLHRLGLLIIDSCNSLSEIVGSEAALGGVALGGFPKLRQMYLTGLPKLENLFSSPSAAHAFAPDLQDLIIWKCENMVEIVSEGSTGKDVVPGDDASSSSPHSPQIIFPRLTRLELGFLPNLTGHCPSGYLLRSESSLKIEDYDEEVSSVQSEETLQSP